MMTSGLKALLAISILPVLVNSSLAQERCYTDGSKKFDDWRAVEGKTLDDLSARCEELGEAACLTTKVNYNGMEMPVAAALIIEGDRYGQAADVKLTQIMGETQDCTKETRTVRGVYDFSREMLGITTILPEKATRIDFEELRKGNVLGGKESFLNKAGRDLDRTLNPFRW